MPDIKDLKEFKEATGPKEAPGPAFDKVIKSLEDAYKSINQPQPLLPLDLEKFHFPTIADVVANLKALKVTVVEGSRQATSLNKVIVKLTRVLVSLAAATAILAAISLYVLITSRS